MGSWVKGQLGGPEATPSRSAYPPQETAGWGAGSAWSVPRFSQVTQEHKTSQTNKVHCAVLIYLVFHASKGNSVVIKVIQFAAPRGGLDYPPLSFKLAFSYFFYLFAHQGRKGRRLTVAPRSRIFNLDAAMALRTGVCSVLWG